MNKIFRTITLVFVLAVAAMGAQAQSDGRQSARQGREEFAAKIARSIAQKLELNAETTNKFVEIYIRCQKEIWELGPPPECSKDRDSQSYTDAQADSVMQARFANSQRMLDIRKKYYAEYSKILTPTQIDRMYKYEHEMFEKLKHRRKHPGHKHPDRKNHKSHTSGKGQQSGN